MKYLKRMLEMTGGDPDGEAKLEKYRTGLLEWNKKVNITNITNLEDFEKLHYADSLSCAFSPEWQRGKRILDVGTGGGFPGIPLAAAFPDKELVLADSLLKRLRIVESLARECDIHNIKVIHGRAEDLARRKDMRESFDICVSRALANMSTLAEYCLPFVKIGGTFISYKGPGEDISKGTRAIKEMGGKFLRKERPELLKEMGLDHRLIYIQKEKDTPKKYPRKAGTPSKDPL